MIFELKQSALAVSVTVACLTLSACGGGGGAENGVETTQTAVSVDTISKTVNGVSATEDADTTESAQAVASTWVQIAKEDASFTVGTSQRVRYGADSRWIVRTLTGAGVCSNSFFGSDPAVKVGKTCQVEQTATSTPVTAVTTTWSQCATEDKTCTFTGTRQVRYGTTAKYYTKTVAGPVSCSNTVFGDPAVGIGKACWVASVLSTVVAAPTPAPAAQTPAPAPAAPAPAPTPAAPAPTPAAPAPAPATSSGNLRANLQASRVSGPAPLAVMFDATGSTDAGGANTTHQVTYEFNFGDDRGERWGPSGGLKNVQSGGPLGSHVFDLPGTYTVRVRATGADGATSESTISVTVQNASTTYAGTQTVCVSSTSNYVGCPSGAAQQTSLPGSYAGKRVLLRRGDSFGGISVRNTDNNFQIGAFGTGAKPRVSGFTAGMVSGVASWAYDYTVMDLNIGTGGVTIDPTGARILVYRCDVNQPAQSAAQMSIGTSTGWWYQNTTGVVNSSIYWPREVFIVENDIQGSLNASGQPGYGLMAALTQSAVLGNTIDRSTWHSVRIWAGHKLQIAHNTLGGNHYAPNGPGIGAALKVQAQGTSAYASTLSGAPKLATRYLVVANNILGSTTYPGSWLVGIGPQNLDPGTQEKLEDVVFENNRIVRGPTTQQDLHVLAGRVTTRGNTVPAGGSFIGHGTKVTERRTSNTLNDAWMGPYWGQIQ